MEITLYYKYLKHDIDQWTYRLSEGRIKDADELKDIAETDDTSSQVSFVRRKIEAACAIMRGKLGTCLTNSSEEELDDKLVEGRSEWSFTISGAGAYSSRADVMTELMHMFVVRWVIAQWCMIYSPNEAASFETRADSAIAMMKEELYKLTAPIKNKRQV